uniref:CST complex subunit STN1 n=1 Tax=Clastoptera arizonana TaxID=38151 RepID=A0A1B6DC52_9HEMI
MAAQLEEKVVNKEKYIYCDLFISDVLNLVNHPTINNTCLLNNNEIRGVTIWGVISGIKTTKDGLSFIVDDGTGEIEAVWESSKDTSHITKKEINSLKTKSDSKMPSQTCALLKELIVSMWKDLELNSPDSFKLGDTVVFTGFLRDFKGKKIVYAKEYRKVEDINEEVARNIYLLHVRSKLYGSPPLGNYMEL